MSSPQPSLSWPTSPTPLRIAELRPVVDRLTSLAHAHERELAVIPGLATTGEEIAADPPPALEQVTDELGGLSVRGRRELDLLVEERTDVGPYTLLGEPTSYYPLHEDEDVAVVLTVAEDGTPGAVYGIGEDLALHLAAPDLGAYLTRFADALEQALSELDDHIRRSWGEPSVEDETARDDALEELLDLHLYRAILGTSEDADDVDADEVAIQDPQQAGLTELPTGTLAVADLRDAPRDARVDVIDAELPGDPLDWHLAWREAGLVVCLVGG